MIDIDGMLTQHDDGYRFADWFRGGHETLERAREAATPEEADAILRAAYLGADIDGVEAKWTCRLAA